MGFMSVGSGDRVRDVFMSGVKRVVLVNVEKG